MEEPLNITQVEEEFKITLSYTLQSAAETQVLAAKLKEDLAETNSYKNTIIVTVKQQVHTADLDDIITTIENVSTKPSLSVLSAVASTGERLFNLEQVNARVLDSTNTTVDPAADIPGIRVMLTPTILVALLIAGFILSIFIFAILQLMYVQTPSVFSSASIDFGKIEK